MRQKGMIHLKFMVRSSIFSGRVLVVFAVLAILGSLLQPSLNTVLESSKTLSCMKHEKAIGLASMQYTEDHNNYLVAIGYYNSMTRKMEQPNWDDSLSSYLGGVDMKRWQAGRESSDGLNPQNNILRCPSDEVPGGAGWERRSYAMNGIGSYPAPSYVTSNEDMWGPGRATGYRSLNDMEDLSGTFVFAERPSYWNLINYHGRSSLPNVGSQNMGQSLHAGSLEGTHGPFTYNYLFLDGHAGNLVAGGNGFTLSSLVEFGHVEH